MSGLHGHIFHLYDYDNPHLSFGDIKNIFKLISDGQMTLYEKVDGQNIVFSYDLKNHNILFARNKGNIAAGGMILSDLQNKWTNLPQVQKTYIQAYKKLNKAFSKIKHKDLVYIFGNKNKIWYSAEIITTLNPNVIHYNTNAIVLHKSGYVFDNKGNRINTNTGKQFDALLDIVDVINKHTNWDIFKPIVLQNKKPTNLNWHIQSLNETMSLYNISDADYIKDFLAKAFIEHQSFIKNFVEHKTIGQIFTSSDYKRTKKKELLHLLGKDDMMKIYPLIQKEEEIKKRLLKPLEWTVHQFATDLLNNIESKITSKPHQEIKRLKKVVNEQILIVEKTHNNKLVQIMTKLGDVNKINSTIEGIIFEYKGNVYKLTGLFSPINQLLGMTRY